VNIFNAVIKINKILKINYTQIFYDFQNIEINLKNIDINSIKKMCD